MDQHPYPTNEKLSLRTSQYAPESAPANPLRVISLDLSTRTMSDSKHVALVAHDNKKRELMEWAYYNKSALARHSLYGTGTTSKLLANHLEQPVNSFQSGPLGGDQQIGAKIAEGTLDILIFFWDPMEAQPHDPDIKALLRLAVVWNIPIANNRATADFLLTSPLFHSPYEVIVPDYCQYLSRVINRQP